jgi:hypothetical protein
MVDKDVVATFGERVENLRAVGRGSILWNGVKATTWNQLIQTDNLSISGAIGTSLSIHSWPRGIGNHIRNVEKVMTSTTIKQSSYGGIVEDFGIIPGADVPGPKEAQLLNIIFNIQFTMRVVENIQRIPWTNAFLNGG